MEVETVYSLPSQAVVRQLLKSIGSAFDLEHRGSASRTRTYYDSHDWLLYEDSLILYSSDDCFYLQDRRDRLDILRQNRATGQSPPRFWWDFPEGPLRKRLKSSLSVRALLNLGGLHIEDSIHHVLNSDRKTVVRLVLQNLANTKHPSKKRHVLRVVPIKGYPEDRIKVDRFIRDAAGITDLDKDLLDIALEGSGRTPGDYSAKVKVFLEPGWSLSRSGTVILRFLHHVMQHNIEGILMDTDTEFLHDFRVSVRRTRAALSQIKGLFPDKDTEEWKGRFAKLGRSSNRLRDLDVYLLREHQYTTMLPETLEKELSPVFQALSTDRTRELAAFSKFLKSRFFSRLTKDWVAFLEKQDTHSGTTADEPVETLIAAKTFILRRYRQILKRGGKITPSSPDESLHRLRIDCKKLRYLLEFFSSLFPAEEIKLLVSQLKKLQDHLGLFNDLSVQQQDLFSFLEEKLNGDDCSRLYGRSRTAAALGGLLSLLSRQQKKVRAEFEQKFNEFSAPENAVKFESLFSTEEIS